ncbi:MAG: hypothetical protein ACKVVP_11295 [Chloroflexota bacterium]
MDIFQALQIAWLIQQLTVIWDQILASVPPEVANTLSANPVLAGVVTGLAILIGLKLVMSVFD